MGRIILTNNRLWCNKLEYNFKKLLELYEMSRIDNPYFMRVYKKKRVNNQNFYQNEYGMITSNGTLIYKELMNELALKELLIDFKKLLINNNIEDCIKKIRRDIIGSYLVVISINDFTIGFVDETSTYACYYYFMKDEYIVTNTFYNINECVNSKYNEMAILENGLCSTIVGKETFFDNIYRLLENEYFIINNKNSKVLKIKNIEVNKYYYDYSTYEEGVTILKSELEKIAKARSKNIKQTLLFTTGGIDSRMELALHNYFNDKVILGYWSGLDTITNGTKEDVTICKKIAKEINLSFKFYDVSVPFTECINSITTEELSKFGEYAFIYAHNPKWLDIPNDVSINIDSIGFGSLNEIMRETPQIDETWYDGFSCKDLVKNVKMRSGIYNNVIANEEVVNYIIEKLNKIYNIENHNLMIDEAVNIFNRNRLHSNTILSSYINLYYFDFNICGQKRIVDLIESMPYQWRQKSKIVLSLTEQWNSKLMKIPYFSHHQRVLYNKKSKTIQNVFFNKIEKRIRKLLKNTYIYRPLILFGQKIKNKNNLLRLESNKILKECNNRLNDSEYIKFSKIKLLNPQRQIGFDLESLAKMTVEIYSIDLIEHTYKVKQERL